jgi:hypothetical protein
MTDASFTFTVNGNTETHKGDMEFDEVREIKIVEMANKQVKKIELRLPTSQATVRVKDQTITNPNPLEGETLVFEKVGLKWKRSLLDKAASDKQEQALQDFAIPECDDDIYPEELVKPGHRWNVNAAKLRRVMGGNAQVESGQWQRKFEKTLTVKGETCSRVADELNLRAKVPDGQGGWATVELRGTGDTLRSLKGGFDISSSLTGTMTMSSTSTVDPQGTGEAVTVDTTISGPVTIEVKIQPR